MKNLRLKVLTYNIHKGFNFGNRRFILEELKKFLHHLHPDIIFLQEVLGDHRHPQRRIEDWPTNAQFEFLADGLWPHFAYGKNAVYDQGHHGNAILSKFPITHWDNTDLSTNSLEGRGLIHGRIKINHVETDLFCTHLNLLHRSRVRQTEQMIKVIKSKTPADAPCLLAGDFNDWQHALSKPLKKQLGLREAFVSVRGSVAKTFPAFHPMLALDRIYYRGWSAQEAKVLHPGTGNRLSDHLPLWAEFTVL